MWNVLTFAWMQELLKKGALKPLEMDDLYPLSSHDTSIGIYHRFRKAWLQQVYSAQKATPTRHPSLLRAFSTAFGYPFMAAGMIKLVHDSSLFIGPVLLNRLIRFLSDSKEPMSTGLKLVAALFVTAVVQSLCLRQYFWWCFRTGMRLRSAVVTAVFTKTMVLSTSVFAHKTQGEVLNLISVDESRLQVLTPYLHAIWYSAYQICLAMLLLWHHMGVSCLSGVCIIILMIPISNRVSFYMKSIQRDLSKLRDTRVKTTNEVLSGIKVIKVQAWETPYLNRIMDIRALEVAQLTRYIHAQCMATALYTANPLLVSLSTFTTQTAVCRRCLCSQYQFRVGGRVGEPLESDADRPDCGWVWAWKDKFYVIMTRFRRR